MHTLTCYWDNSNFFGISKLLLWPLQCVVLVNRCGGSKRKFMILKYCFPSWVSIGKQSSRPQEKTFKSENSNSYSLQPLDDSKRTPIRRLPFWYFSHECFKRKLMNSGFSPWVFVIIFVVISVLSAGYPYVDISADKSIPLTFNLVCCVSRRQIKCYGHGSSSF